MCLENISGDVSANNMKKNRIKWMCVHFSVDYTVFNTSNIIDIHKYLMKKHDTKIMFGLIKKVFIVLLTGLFNGSNHAKCTSLSNQKCMI